MQFLIEEEIRETLRSSFGRHTDISVSIDMPSLPFRSRGQLLPYQVLDSQKSTSEPATSANSYCIRIVAKPDPFETIEAQRWLLDRMHYASIATYLSKVLPVNLNWRIAYQVSADPVLILEPIPFSNLNLFRRSSLIMSPKLVEQLINIVDQVCNPDGNDWRKSLAEKISQLESDRPEFEDLNIISFEELKLIQSEIGDLKKRIHQLEETCGGKKGQAPM